ncbi:MULTISPECIES: hypothetical protein [Citrobacter]|uniref:Uncharacterized protein n=1 Tax=Citrobacter cronae TaxID=1748967 RepID=A0A7X1EJR3_9ENTR|nr:MULTISPECIES: hypothetical protein [Citrobacter]MBS6074190.1 hypothetical protein [Citrobacter freundii]MBC2622651.1 hypothetical protein [Citrobacter cronae]MBJ8365199.1 hypothetical protein [Citrobacter cronae]MBJ8416073.1 hypothetical protein [Citrobacter cronae]MBU5388376.1 hypothetical protein [Citrobacter cronae]
MVPELRKAMEESQQQDDDGSLVAWIKRVVRKELKQKGIEVWWPEFCIVF